MEDRKNETEGLYSLTKRAACHRARSFSAPQAAVNRNIGSAGARTTAIRAVIRYALERQDKKRSDIAWFLSNRYRAAGFATEEQKRQVLLSDLTVVMRYLRDEYRMPEFPDPADVMMTASDGRTVKKNVRVDAAFTCGSQVDLVVYKIGKATMTQSGEKGAFERDLKLYAMVLYGRLLGYRQITASLYYLRKNLDGTPGADPSFFGGGGNILTLSDVYTGSPNELDRQMDPLIQEYLDGYEPEEMSEKEDCIYCPYAALCTYQKPPARIEEEA